MQIKPFAAILAALAAIETTHATDLATVYRQSAESSPLVAQAQARLQAEQSGKDIARSSLAPRLSAEGSISRNNLDLSGFGPVPIHEEYDPAGYSVTLTQPLINAAAHRMHMPLHGLAPLPPPHVLSGANAAATGTGG